MYQIFGHMGRMGFGHMGRMGFGHMGRMGCGFFGSLGYLPFILVLVGGFILYKMVDKNKKNAPSAKNQALEILHARYARGEIDTTEYEEKRNEISRM